MSSSRAPEPEPRPPARSGPWGAATRAVHTGRDGRAGAPVVPPIAMAATFRHGADALYGRDDNETWEAFEEVLGDLEGGSCLAFASGMAAISAVLETTPVGGIVTIAQDSYNGTRKWAADAVARGRFTTRLVDVTDTAAVVDAARGAHLVWLESPTNPCMAVADIAAITAGAHALGARVAVDNTVATPILQRPLTLGADVVVHSVTKWIGGHADLVMGAAITADPELLDQLRTRRSLGGAIAGSVEAWLALRGLRTLPARLARAQATAQELAARLERHPAVARVRYPGLPSDPGFAVASRQMAGPGGLISFDMHGGAEAAEAVCGAVRLLVPGTSLGGVETMIERRSRYAFEDLTPPGLLRMSVGQEDGQDLWDDLAEALDAQMTAPSPPSSVTTG